jgi:serine O-acetyltransferase
MAHSDTAQDAQKHQDEQDRLANSASKHGLYAVPSHAPAPPTTDLAGMAGVAAPNDAAQPPEAAVPRIRTRWPDDIDVIFEKDPAARNVFEALTYQGLHAILLHRIAHRLYLAGVPVVPRLISQVARVLTGGIEIHPGARIGKRFFIDHGAGVVIGETAEIGDNVMLYHQVTLGATGWWKHRGDGRVKRHPTIGDNVTIGVGASILGPVTVGHDSKIGAMALVLENIPPNSLVVSQPARLLTSQGGQADLETQLADERPFLLDYTI